jgi:hypothetical protein
VTREYAIRLVGALVLLLGAAALPGCSSEGRSGVQGTVTYDGQPIPVGTITLLPTGEKGIKCGGRIENGHYQIEPRFGPMPGPHRVEIRWAKPTGKKYKNAFGEVFDVTSEGLPDKYHAHSRLTAMIKSGANVLNLSLAK